MARLCIATEVARTLTELGVTATVERGGKHPRVLWSDPQSGQRGIITTPGSASDHRSLLNNVTMARRIIRAARGG